MRTFLLLLPIVVATPAGVSAQSHYLTQTANGDRRVCIYEQSVTQPGQRREVTRLVGLGEPCPPSLRDIPQTTAEDVIPVMALLASQSQSDGQLVCVYSYLGQEYRKSLNLTESCPLTPHFAPAVGVTSSPQGR